MKTSLRECRLTQKEITIIIAGAISLAIILLLMIFQWPWRARVWIPSGQCPSQGQVVCGTDGSTYANECLALKKPTVGIAHTGACIAGSKMTDYERNYLMWLLLQRKEMKLPDQPIRHHVSVVYRCPDCYDLYYIWGSPTVYAKITVTDGSVTYAQDTQGYDYLQKKQVSPASFPELQKVKGEGELCGGIGGFLCADTLICRYTQDPKTVSDASGVCVKP